MSETQQRVQALVAELRSRQLDALLVGSGANLRYLTDFTGSNGLVAIDASGADRHRFYTDFRYATQSAEQVPGLYEREIVANDMLEAMAERLGAGGRLGFDDARTSVKQHGRLQEILGKRWQLIGCAGAVESLREVKSAAEIAAIGAACKLADAALEQTLERGLVGRSERDVAIDLELTMRRLGAQAPSFPSIVAGGQHGALPHAEPRDVAIERGTLVTIDWGAYLDGYCSDCTRTFATGEPSELAGRVYTLVLGAQEAALAAVRAGITGVAADAVAREAIDAAGHGEHFGHGLGHGVGLEVHEGPRLSRTAGEEPLRVGNVVTVEPGVYLPGQLGVRIEDLVVVGQQRCERLTLLPKQLQTID